LTDTAGEFENTAFIILGLLFDFVGLSKDVATVEKVSLFLIHVFPYVETI